MLNEVVCVHAIGPIRVGPYIAYIQAGSNLFVYLLEHFNNKQDSIGSATHNKSRCACRPS